MTSHPPPPDYMNLLPQIYRRCGDSDHPLVEDYLKIFEKILTGEASLDENTSLTRRKGIGETLDVLAGLFHPRFSFLFDPEGTEFIPPLLGDKQEEHERALNGYVGATYAEYSANADSSWQLEFNEWLNQMLDWMGRRIGLRYNPKWDVDTRRKVAASFMPYDRKRGTVDCLALFLQAFLGSGDPQKPFTDEDAIRSLSVYDLSTQYLTSGSSSQHVPIKGYRVGVNTILAESYVEGAPLLGGYRPYAWLVQIVFRKSGRAEVDNALARFREVFDQEKPALGSDNIQLQVPFMVGPESATQLGINACLVRRQF